MVSRFKQIHGRSWAPPAGGGCEASRDYFGGGLSLYRHPGRQLLSPNLCTQRIPVLSPSLHFTFSLSLLLISTIPTIGTSLK